MFGYIKPMIGELKVKDSELYRAYYCGLCRALGRYGLAGRASLTYDAAFAAMLLTAATGQEPDFAPHGCVLHPLRGKTSAAERTPILDYCAALCVLLAKYKLRDDAGDGRPMRRCLLPALAPAAKKAARAYPDMERELRAGLAALNRIEASGEPDPDAAPLCFGGLLSRLICACPGLAPERLGIIAELGRAIGGFVYVVDAWDDREEDKKRGSYNVFNLVEERGFTSLPDGRFEGEELAGASAPSIPDRESGSAMGEAELREMCAAMIDMYINSAVLAFDLLEPAGCTAVLDNIIKLGLGASADSVLSGGRGNTDTKKEGMA